MRSLSFHVRGPHDASGFHPFPGMNEVVAANRGGWGGGHALKRRMTELVARAAREAMGDVGWIAPLVPVRVSMTWHEVNRRRDVDNVMSAQKFVLDGLVEAGAIRGDSRRWVPEATTHEVVVDKDHPGVTVEVTTMEEE